MTLTEEARRYTGAPWSNMLDGGVGRSIAIIGSGAELNEARSGWSGSGRQDDEDTTAAHVKTWRPGCA